MLQRRCRYNHKAQFVRDRRKRQARLANSVNQTRTEMDFGWACAIFSNREATDADGFYAARSFLEHCPFAGFSVSCLKRSAGATMPDGMLCQQVLLRGFAEESQSSVAAGC
jgi:hypothetical protein